MDRNVRSRARRSRALEPTFLEAWYWSNCWRLKVSAGFALGAAVVVGAVLERFSALFRAPAASAAVSEFEERLWRLSWFR
jgi:hypothetical protein